MVVFEYCLSSSARMLLCLSSCLFDDLFGLGVGFEEPENFAGDGSFEAAFDVASGLAVSGAPGCVGLGLGVVL